MTDYWHTIGVVVMIVVCALLVHTLAVRAEEVHDHSLMDPKADAFLRHWKQPRGGGQRTTSCCNFQDCDEVETRRGAQAGVEFKSRVTGQWTPIPPTLLEQNQPDTEWSPNGKPWVCQSRTQLRVICATLGDPGI